MNRQEVQKFVDAIVKVCKDHGTLLDVELTHTASVVVYVRDWHDSLNLNSWHDYRGQQKQEKKGGKP